MPRTPAVAGQFYPADPADLMTMISDCTPTVSARRRALGVLCPHAGYIFSGPTAGATLAEVDVPRTVVLLTPSHHYSSPPCALWTGGEWKTPIGQAAIHEKLTRALAELPAVTADDRPHLSEWSGEVIVPFLLFHRRDVRIAVICITPGAGDKLLKELGEGIAEALKRCGESDALVVASSDMSHESGPDAAERVNRQDPPAIARMEALDAPGLLELLRDSRVSMCGALPAAAMMAGVAARGGTRGELIHRATSADSEFGSGSYIVGYAGMIFY